MTRSLALLLLLYLCAPTSVWAQDPVPPPQTVSTGDPVSLTVAMSGVVVTSAGFALMLHTTAPCYCEPRTAWVVGGLGVVVAGVTMVWLGLRPKHWTVYPAAAPHAVGAFVTRQWGAR